MKYFASSLLIAAAFLVPSARGQNAMSPSPEDAPPTLDIAGGFTAVHANAAPAQCGCFYMYGGSAQVVANDASGISFVFDYGTTNTSNINGENHNLRLSTYLAGGRYTYRSQRKFSPFGQVLVGVGHSNTNFVIDKSTSTIAFSTGGGVDYDISSRFSIRIAQAEYLLTHVPNGVNNEQNQIRLTSGVVFHITKSKK